jgi:hypothetical protein
MAAEGVAHDGQHAVGEVVFLAGPDAANHRLGNYGRGNVQVDGLEDRPAALAGVGDVGLKPVQRGVELERLEDRLQKLNRLLVAAAVALKPPTT